MRSRKFVGVMVCTLAIAACGVREQSEPAEIASEDIPFGLVERPNQGANSADERQTVVLFFLGPDGLVEVERTVTGAATPAGAMRALLAGPQPSERSEGTSSALVESTAARLEGTRGGVARVSLDSGFQDGEIGNEPAALAEIVYTLTAFPHIERVSFRVEGDVVAVPRPDGSLVSRPVSREDYAQVLTEAQP